MQCYAKLYDEDGRSKVDTWFEQMRHVRFNCYQSDWEFVVFGLAEFGIPCSALSYIGALFARRVFGWTQLRSLMY